MSSKRSLVDLSVNKRVISFGHDIPLLQSIWTKGLCSMLAKCLFFWKGLFSISSLSYWNKVGFCIYLIKIKTKLINLPPCLTNALCKFKNIFVILHVWKICQSGNRQLVWQSKSFKSFHVVFNLVQSGSSMKN